MKQLLIALVATTVVFLSFQSANGTKVGIVPDSNTSDFDNPVSETQSSTSGLPEDPGTERRLQLSNHKKEPNDKRHDPTKPLNKHVQLKKSKENETNCSKNFTAPGMENQNNEEEKVNKQQADDEQVFDLLSGEDGIEKGNETYEIRKKLERQTDSHVADQEAGISMWPRNDLPGRNVHNMSVPGIIQEPSSSTLNNRGWSVVGSRSEALSDSETQYPNNSDNPDGSYSGMDGNNAQEHENPDVEDNTTTDYTNNGDVNESVEVEEPTISDERMELKELVQECNDRIDALNTIHLSFYSECSNVDCTRKAFVDENNGNVAQGKPCECGTPMEYTTTTVRKRNYRGGKTC